MGNNTPVVDSMDLDQDNQETEAGTANAASAVQIIGNIPAADDCNWATATKHTEIQSTFTTLGLKQQNAIDENPEESSVNPSYSNDPAFWDRRNEGLIEFIVSSPPKLDLNQLDVSTSMIRHDSQGHIRRLTKEMFYRKHIRLKENDLLRSWLAFSAKNGTVYCIPCFFLGRPQVH